MNITENKALYFFENEKSFISPKNRRHKNSISTNQNPEYKQYNFES